MLTLEIKYPSGHAETQTFPGPITIGRDIGDVILGDPQVSARHAEIQIVGEAATYVDLGSTNGSFTIDGDPITSVPLRVGTVVCLGACKITVLKLPTSGRLPKHGPLGTLVASADELAAAVGAGPFLPLTPGGQGAFPVPSVIPGMTSPAPPLPLGMSPRLPPLGELALSVIGPTPDSPLEFVNVCWQDYKEHLLDGAKILGYLTVPPALLGGLLGLLPFVGPIFGLLVYALLLPLVLLAILLVGSGAVQEYGLRLAMGQAIDHKQALRIQSRRLVPFFLGTLPSLCVSFVGYLFCLIPGVLASFYLYPAYLVEGKRGLEPNQRSFALLQADWRAMVPTAIVSSAGGVATWLVSSLVGALPIVGSFSGAVAALGSALLSPFVAFVVYRTYFSVRRKLDGVAALQADLALLPRL